MLVITAYHDYNIWHMDIKTTFLNGNIIEDVYMTQLGGFIPNKQTDKVASCKGLFMDSNKL